MMVIAPLIMVVKAAEVMADMVVLIEEDTKQKSKLASIASKKLNNISLTPIMI